MRSVSQQLKNLQQHLEQDGVFKFAKILKKQFANSQIYLVGGSVRDALLGKVDSKDYDFVVRGVKKNALLKVLKNLGWVDLVGKTFGVYKFRPTNLKIKLAEPLDIALPRTEVSTLDGGYRDFEIQTDENLSIEEDLSRRDFTVNALAWDVFDKKLIDPFGGQSDLSRQRLKTVGKPQARFEEDYSRMLRGIRFACQLKFRIDDLTWQAVCELIQHINDTRTQKHENNRTIEQSNNRTIGSSTSQITSHQSPVTNNRIVPYEVISAELLKAFLSDPVRAFDLYDQSGAFAQLMPEILPMKACPQPKEFHTEGDVWQHTRLTLKNLASRTFNNYLKKVENRSVNSDLILACLFHDVGKVYTLQTPEKDGSDRIRFNGHNEEGAKMARKICERLKISSPARIGANPEYVAWLVKNHLLLLCGDVTTMRATTLEKYFFTHEYPGDDLIKLAVADALATIPPDGKPVLDTIKLLLERLAELKKLNKEKNRLPAPLLNGDEIMNLLGLKPGKKVGQLLTQLREEQLNGKVKNKAAAKKFLKNL